MIVLNRTAASLPPITTPWVSSIAHTPVVPHLKPAFTRASQHLTSTLNHAKTWASTSIAISATTWITMQNAMARDFSVQDKDGSWIVRSSLGLIETLAEHSLISGLICLGSSILVIGVPAIVMLGGGGLLYRRYSGSLSDDTRLSRSNEQAAKLSRHLPAPSNASSLSRLNVSQIGDANLRKILEEAKRRLQQSQQSILSAGQTLKTSRDEYEVMGFLGAGGMANVYLMRRKRDDELVVFKQMQKAMAQREVGTLKFMDEVKMIKGLTENGVKQLVAYVDVLGEPLGVFLEYLPNGDLNETLQGLKHRRESMTLEQALVLFIDVATCLVGLNNNNICHRDLKPENIFLYTDTNNQLRAKVGDLGLAKNLEVRMTEAPRGTPYFMAPEQFDYNADIRSDMYALGIIMYETFTQRHPHNLTAEANHFSQIKSIVASNKITPLQDLRPDLPQHLCDVIMLCLQAHPKDRFQSPDVLVKNLKMSLKLLNPDKGDDTFEF